MARALRLIAPGHPHHLLLRGHNRQAVFADDADRQQFLACLRDVCKEQGLALHAYVLMPEHVHLLLTPGTEAAVGRAMQALGRRYVSHFNRRHGRTGGLWEGRYRACVIDTEAYFLACQRHIETHPRRSGLASDLLSHPWSSLPHHLGQRSDPLVTDHAAFWALGNTPFDREAAYREFLDGSLPAERQAQLQRALTHGGVLGRPEFVHQLGFALQRDLAPRRRGRPVGSTRPKKTDPI